MLKLPKLVEKNCDNWESFVEFWEKHYHEGKVSNDDYLSHLKWEGGKLTYDDVKKLLEWKTDKRKLPLWRPQRLKPYLSQLNKHRLTSNPAIWKIAEKLSKEGLVLQVFVCHITSPLEYPIWDINVLKAYLIINNRRTELSSAKRLRNSRQEYDNYRKTFKLAVNKIKDSKYPAFRRLDRALFALGQNSELF